MASSSVDDDDVVHRSYDPPSAFHPDCQSYRDDDDDDDGDAAVTDADDTPDGEGLAGSLGGGIGMDDGLGMCGEVRQDRMVVLTKRQVATADGGIVVMELVTGDDCECREERDHRPS